MFNLTNITLKDYQVEGVNYLLKHQHAVLGDEMGLGKTVQALAVASANPSLKTLIVAPAYLIPNWKQEIDRFCPHINYELVSYSPITLRKKRQLFVQTDIVIFDEVHYLKNPSAQRTQVVHSYIESHPPKYLLGLSGTPIKNRVPEWYSLIYLTCYGSAPNGLQIQDQWYSNYYKFCHNFSNAVKITVKGRPVTKFLGAKNTHTLKNLLRSKYLRRKAKDVLELPDQNYIYRDLGGDDGELLDAWENFGNGDKELIQVKVENALSKVKYTIEYAKGLMEQGYKVLIFTDHVKVVQEVKEKIKGALGITGSTPSDQRMKIVNKFNETDAGCLVGTIGSMSTGFNMTTCNQVIFNDISWVPADNLQAEKRVHRIGQDKKCFYHVILSGRMDKMIFDNVKEKIKVLEAVT